MFILVISNLNVFTLTMLKFYQFFCNILMQIIGTEMYTFLSYSKLICLQEIFIKQRYILFLPLHVFVFD